MFYIFDLIAKTLGKLMLFIYDHLAFFNYGLAIIIFTVIVKMILLPLTIKQYQSMAKTQEAQPKLQEIQKRYKNDKEKLNQELMNFYKENNINPMGGCLPMLIQMPILFSLYYVVRDPNYYMYGIKKTNPTEGINMSFIGLDLGRVPDWHFNNLIGNYHIYLPLLIIPVLAAFTTFLSIKYTSMTNSSATQGNDMAQSMNKNMLLMMPIMTGFFAFNAPAGLGLYWCVNNIIQILQQMFMNKFILKKKEEVATKQNGV